MNEFSKFNTEKLKKKKKKNIITIRKINILKLKELLNFANNL